MKRMLGLALAMLVLLVPTAAFASSAELSDVQRPVDGWLYNGGRF